MNDAGGRFSRIELLRELIKKSPLAQSCVDEDVNSGVLVEI